MTIKPNKLSLAAIILSIFITFILVGRPVAAQEKQLTPKEILDRVDDLFRGDSSRGRMDMSITTANWSRTLSLEFWNKGKDRALIRILAPKKEKGMATLRSGNEIWNYLPKVKRVIKLPSSMMAASWMGSHFTNDDLVKESRMADDYTFDITARETVDGIDTVELTCLPKPTAAVVWGKVVLRADAGHYLPLDIKYYDEDMALARTMTFTENTTFGDRTLPRLMTIQPEDKPGEKTEVLYKDIRFNIDLKDSVFSLRTLQR